jgi:N-acetylglutamate synthase-like GNAT family acetyltransferase
MLEQLQLRVATHRDIPVIEELIRTSVRGLSIGYYDAAQIESAIAEVFGVDSQLIDDHTYYVIELQGALVAAGGWSARRTLFGGDHMKRADDPLLDPISEPARIRAFFVHPHMARRGLARWLFDACEREARAAGFREFVLMATLPGQPLYRTLGFSVVESVVLPLSNGVALPLVRMRRPLGA